MALLYEDKTAVLRKCLFEVQNEVGLGRREEAYHRACEVWLEQRGVPFRSKQAHHLFLAGEPALTLFPDFVAWDSIAMELKAVARNLEHTEFVQVFDYLKCREDRLGLMVNMGLDRVHVERLIYDVPRYELREDWEHWRDQIQGRDRDLGSEVRAALQTIFDEPGTGYGSEVTQKLVVFEMRRRGLPLVVSPMCKAFFRGVEVDESALDCLVIDDRILLTLTALFDDNGFSINRGKSFLKALGLAWGIAANFGKKEAQFSALAVSA